jgi:hypothetical protein
MSKSTTPRKLVFYCHTSAATLAELERMKRRDGITAGELIARAVTAYKLMYPGPDYRPPEIRPK